MLHLKFCLIVFSEYQSGWSSLLHSPQVLQDVTCPPPHPPPAPLWWSTRDRTSLWLATSLPAGPRTSFCTICPPTGCCLCSASPRVNSKEKSFYPTLTLRGAVASTGPKTPTARWSAWRCWRWRSRTPGCTSVAAGVDLMCAWTKELTSKWRVRIHLSMSALMDSHCVFVFYGDVQL